MALKTLANKLTVEKDKKLVVNPIYDEKTFYGTQKKRRDLSEANIYTKEGLDQFSKATGEDPSKYSIEKLELAKNSTLTGTQKDISEYVKKHINKVIEGLSKERKIDSAFNYCPKKDLAGNHKPYNETRGIVSSAKEEITMIRDKSEEYLASELEKEKGNAIVTYMVMYGSKELLEIDSKEAQKNGIAALNRYDTGKFLRLTTQNIKNQAKTLEEKIVSIDKVMQTKINKIEDKKGTLSSIDRMKLIAKESEEVKKAYETNPDAKTLNPLIEDISTIAFQEIEAKKAA